MQPLLNGGTLARRRNALSSRIVVLLAVTTSDVAESLDRQGVRLVKIWRATRVALGARGAIRYLAGEIFTAAPAVVFAVLVAFRFHPAHLVWVMPIGFAWLSRSGQATALGCVFSLAAIVLFGTLAGRLLVSPLHLLGAFCIPWTWLAGASMRGTQKIAIVQRLAGDHDLYARLRTEGAISGPASVTFDTVAG
jgi:hypothetical protein